MAGRPAAQKRELVSFVHVADENGVSHVFGPGDEVPGWAAEKVTNPKAWNDVEASKSE